MLGEEENARVGTGQNISMLRPVSSEFASRRGLTAERKRQLGPERLPPSEIGRTTVYFHLTRRIG
eukprot:2852499-Rhodomonas_salina.4